MDDLTIELSFDSKDTRVIDVLGLFVGHIIHGCLYIRALADVRSTGAGIKCLYCIAYYHRVDSTCGVLVTVLCNERDTAVTMDTIDQLSTYIYGYVDNYQNNIYDREIMILFLSQIEFLPIYGKSSICSRRVYTATYRHSVILTSSQSKAETKRNTCNNFTKSL